jgi:hypothetical protein
MAKDPIQHKPSALEKVSLSFEYDMTWRDAKKAIRVRTHKQ